MFSKLIPLGLLLVSLVSAQHDHNNHSNHELHRVNVTVYYESLCPDSIKFFTQQLYPSLQSNLSKFVNLTLLPYGKSHTTKEQGSYVITCHHGPGECMGNRLQACALRQIESGAPTQGLGYNKVATGFINCLMDKVKPAGNDTVFPVADCATINHVQQYVDIENCAKLDEGVQLLNEIGEATAALQPALTSVPTIVFNNKYKLDDTKLAQTNFVKALCQYIEHDKPAECSKNSAYKLTFSFVTIFVALAATLY